MPTGMGFARRPRPARSRAPPCARARGINHLAGRAPGCASCPRCRSARSGALCGVGALAAVRRSGAGGAERDRSGHGAALLRRRRRALPRGRASKAGPCDRERHGPSARPAEGRAVATRRVGEVIGAASALTGEPHPETVVATMPTETLSLGRDRFEALLDRWPDVRANVLRIVYRRFARSLAHGARERERGEAVALLLAPASPRRPTRSSRQRRRLAPSPSQHSTPGRGSRPRSPIWKICSRTTARCS